MNAESKPTTVISTLPQRGRNLFTVHGVRSLVVHCGGLLGMTIVLFVSFLIPLAAQARPWCMIMSTDAQGQCQRGCYQVSTIAEVNAGRCRDSTYAWYSDGSVAGCTRACVGAVGGSAATGSAVGGGGASSVVGLPNPLGTSDPAVIIGRIIKTFTGFAGAIGLLMFVYGGFIWLTSFGNPERIKKGQDLLLWTTIGLAIMFSSYIVARYIITAVTRGTGTL